MQQLRQLGSRATRWIWRLRHLVPLTPLGAAVVGLGAWLALSVGASEVDYVVHAGGLVAIAAVGVTTVLVVVAALRVRVGLSKDPGVDLSLETGRTATTNFELPCLRRWPLVQVRAEWECPREVTVTLKPRQAGTCDELVTPRSRGEALRIVRRVMVEDIFGFARLGLPAATRGGQRVRVSPARTQVTANVIARLAGGEALSHPTGPADGELLEMRRYVHGDPLRHVLWKAFARTRKLLVRAPERAITPRPSAVAYLVAGPGDEPTAAAARFFVEEGMLGTEFLFRADGAAGPTGVPGEALEQIIRSAASRKDGGAGLSDFVGGLSAHQRESCVLFVPAHPGRWLQQVERVAPLLRSPRAVLAIDEAPAPGAPGRMRRLLFADDGRARTMRATGRVLRRLSAAGLQVHVLHRPSGELLGQAQVAALAGSSA